MSYNMLLDPLPDNYEGYLIHTPFYYGILISQCLSDAGSFLDGEIGAYEQIGEALRLLYGNGVPPFEQAMAGLKWFLSGGREKEEPATNEKADEYFSFDEDDSRVFAAFFSKHNVDLSKSDMHWFQFLALLQEIQGTTLSNVIEWRSLDEQELKNYSPEMRRKLREQQKKFAIKKTLDRHYTPEEQEKIRKFNEALGE